MKKYFIIGFVIIIVSIVSILFIYKKSKIDFIYMEDFVSKRIEDVRNYVSKYDLQLEIVEKDTISYDKDVVIEQSIPPGDEIHMGDFLKITVSTGNVDVSLYQESGINELGNIPVMMYHGIVNMASSDTKYFGGNVDIDGYQRTVEAFRSDLEFYYEEGYRMIRLQDYIHGKIDVPFGKSPIVLTFDDGLENNILVTGVNENGELMIDPNSAIGVLEEFKKKYPDFQVTATFFVNGGLFRQPEYNEKILTWLVDHGYDVGNHTNTHANLQKISSLDVQKEVASIYQKLDQIIPGRYVSIVALPFGTPYSKEHANAPFILNGTYEGYSYSTESTLRVAWESNPSPFSIDFDKTFIKRIRAYDNNGLDFDIEMNFKMLDIHRYVSDGNMQTIAYPKDLVDKANIVSDLKIIEY